MQQVGLVQASVFGRLPLQTHPLILVVRAKTADFTATLRTL
jgi:hypothetical protein